MSLNPIEQFKKALASAKKPLILLPQNPDGDAIGSGWAFYFFIKKNNFDPTIAFYDPLNNVRQFDFLPKPKNLQKDVLGSRDFILSFNTTRNKIIEIKTEEKKDTTLIHITPEYGAIDPRDFSFVPAKFKYDLIICLNSPDKETLGKIFEDNPDMFYEIPVINIDHHSTNDNFGQINIVDITASSTAETVYNLLTKINFNLSEKISNCLLTGIISATNSFQNKLTTPQSLKISSELMDGGANQQKIIRHLYKTQPFNILKLLGKVMSKLKRDNSLNLVWATVSIEDFVQSRSEPSDLPFVIDKIQSNYENGELFLILYLKKPQLVKGVLKISSSKILEHKNLNIFENGKLTGDLYTFELKNLSLEEAEKICLQKLNSLQETL